VRPFERGRSTDLSVALRRFLCGHQETRALLAPCTRGTLPVEMISRLFPPTLCVVLATVVASAGLGREIRIPAETPLQGSVLIAERFEEWNGDEWLPLAFPVWPGDDGMRTSDWFEVRIEAHSGDVLVLDPREYTAQIWIFASGITVMTEPEAGELATVLGTVEIDADDVTLERIGVTDSENPHDSGHGIEVNRELLDTVTIRGCRSSGNRWTGVHIVGARGRIRELRVEDCVLVDNGMDGMDAVTVDRLVITGCTITGNGWGLSTGVGVRILSSVLRIVMADNVIENNRFADVHHND